MESKSKTKVKNEDGGFGPHFYLIVFSCCIVMKIAFFTQNSGNYICGSKQYPWLIAHTLANFGHDVTIYTNVMPLFDREFLDFESRKNIKIIVDLNYGIYDLEGRRNRSPKNREIITHLKSCDLFVVAPYDSTDYGMAAAKFFKKKCIVLLHETNDMINDANSNGLELVKIEDHLMNSYQKQVVKADAIMVNSDIAKQSIRQWLPNYRGLVEVINIPVNSYAADHVKTHSLNEKENSVVFCSRTLKYKGFGEIPYIFGQEYFLKQKPVIHYISGFIDGKFNQVHTQFFDLCKEAGLNMKIHNRITESEKFNLMSKSLLTFVPSRYEPIGLTIAESLYVGTPVVCYEQSTIRSLYNEFPHFVEYGNIEESLSRMIELFEDKKRLYQAIDKAKDYVRKRFSIETFNKYLNEFIFKVTGTKANLIDIKPVKKPEVKIEKETRLKPLFKSTERITVISIGEQEVGNLENQTHQSFTSKKIKHISEIENLLKEINDEYVVLVNSGTTLTDRSLEEIMIRFITEKCDLVCGNFEDKNARRTKLTQYSVDQCIIKPDCIRDLIAIRTEVLKEYASSIDSTWDFNLCLKAHDKKWYYSRKKLCKVIERPFNWKRCNSLIRDHFAELNLNDWQAFCNKNGKNVNSLEYIGDNIKPLVVVLTRNRNLMIDFLLNFKAQTLESDLVVGIHIKNKDEKNENEIKALMKEEKIRYKFLKGEFNFSKMNNEMVDEFIQPEHTHVVLVNDDVLLREDALNNILSTFKYRWKDVGVVGAKMLFPKENEDEDYQSLTKIWHEENHLIQHAGVAVLKDINAVHRFYKVPGNRVSLNYMMSMWAVTFGFVAIDADCYQSIRLDENYPSDLNDMDFCLRAIKKGWRVVYNPFAVAFHKESASRRESGHSNDPEGQKRFKRQYKKFLDTCITLAEHNEFLNDVI